jgi:hypothetical protein
MKTYVNNSIFMAVVITLVTAPLAMAWDFRDYNDKAWNSIYKREHSATTSRAGRTAAPVIVRSDTAKVEVAQVPNRERANSYEPSKDTAASTPCGGKATSTPAPSTARKATSNRSFSYEPGVNYSAPVIRQGGSGGENSYQRAMRAKGY